MAASSTVCCVKKYFFVSVLNLGLAGNGEESLWRAPCSDLPIRPPPLYRQSDDYWFAYQPNTQPNTQPNIPTTYGKSSSFQFWNHTFLLSKFFRWGQGMWLITASWEANQQNPQLGQLLIRAAAFSITPPCFNFKGLISILYMTSSSVKLYPTYSPLQAAEIRGQVNLNQPWL